MERPNFRGYMRILILDLLREPNHGYGIMAVLEEKYGIKLSAGTVYPILASLKKSGLIEIVGTGDRERKSYVITSRGVKYLEEHSAELEDAKRKLRAYKLFLELGGNELKLAFKELFEKIEGLDDLQKEEIRRTFDECARKIRLTLLGD